ncbi:MAG TPA: YvcK family protein [Candidatus Omnitrophota bacterium]|nr:YvcK family protein [Candidatus Omnitrophota bacterium]
MPEQRKPRFFKWFYPGMGIKRWISVCTSGLFLIVLVAVYTIRSFSKNNVLLAAFSTALVIFGVFLIYTGIQNMLRIFVKTLMPERKEELVDLVYQKRQERFLERGPRVVAIGGGTGLSTLLQGLKKYTKNITAIVTVTDTGGSSGRLRDELDILPPGDIRNCLVALADAEPLMLQLFQYRFENGSGLKGHSFGNLFITALSKVTGDFDKAIKESSKVLAIRGHVIPSTLEKVSLVGEFFDGAVLKGETNITGRGMPIKRVWLEPENCHATPESLDAIENADVIICGPGSLFTSVLPNLLISEILQKILSSEAKKFYVANVMTQPGETDGFSVFDHLESLIRHTDPRLVDTVFVNTDPVPENLLTKYQSQNASQVRIDIEKIRERGYEVVEGSMVKFGEQVRHDPELLAKLMFEKLLEMNAQKDRVTVER